MNKKNKQVRQQDAYQANAGEGAVTTVQDPRPLFKGNIFVADCMPLILAYSKLYGSVEWQVVYDKMAIACVVA